MRLPWLAAFVAAATPACNASPPPPPQPAPVERASADEAERRHVTECVRGVVAGGEVLRVGPSRYRGRAATAVSISAPGDDVVDVYYGDGPGCDLMAMVGGARSEADVRPGTPFESLAEARRTALSTQEGAVAGWALEREGGGEVRWAYRFDVETGGRLRAVFVDALGARHAYAEARSAAAPTPPAVAPTPPVIAPTTPPPAPAAPPAAAPPPTPVAAPKPAKARASNASAIDPFDARRPDEARPAPTRRPNRRSDTNELALPSDLYDERL
ncbi:MAG TPA: PepSY domain-containing protein [Polyangiaceae bacterium]|nr:PepSY domain-containing protein [Polyangiaceae bacterium]